MTFKDTFKKGLDGLVNTIIHPGATTKIFLLSVGAFAGTAGAQQASISGQAYDSHFQGSWVPGTVVETYIETEIVDKDTIDSDLGYFSEFNLTDIKTEQGLPLGYQVYQNYPNPFNPHTTVRIETPEQNQVDLRVYNLLGQELSDLTTEQELPAGTHNIELDLDRYASGPYFYSVTVSDKTYVNKMMLLHGTTPSQGNGSSFSKVTNGVRVVQKFSNDNYATDSLVIMINPGDNLTGQNINLQQIPTPDAINADLHINRTPTNTNGSNLNIDETQGYFSGVTNATGNFSQTDVGIEYIFNPQNSNDKMYIPEEFVVQISGPNVMTTNENFVVDGQDINETINVAQTQIPKTNSLEVFVNDNQTLQGIENAEVEVFDESVSLGTGTTGTNGISQFALNYLGYEGDPDGAFNNIGVITIAADATNYDPNQVNADFRQTMNETVPLTYNPQTTTVDFTIHWFDVNGNPATNGDFQIKWEQEGPLITYTNDGTGKIFVSEELTNITPTDSAEINHTNLIDYLHWDIGRTYELNQYDKEPIFQNNDWNTNAYFNIQMIDELENIYIFAIPRTVTYTAGTLQTNQAPYIDMMNRLPGFVIHSKPYPGIPNQRWVQLEENGTTGDPIPIEQLDRALEKFQYVFEACTLSNGVITQINEPIQRLSINSPEWQQYLNEELKNVHYTYFANVPAGNAVIWTIDPDLRIYASFSEYPTSQTDGVLLEEMQAQISNTASNASYIFDPNTGGLTETGLTMLRTNKLMRTWTQYYPTTTMPEKIKENALYTTTSTTDSEGQRIIYTIMEENKN